MKIKELEYDKNELLKEVAELKKELNYYKQYKEALDRTTIISKTDLKGNITDVNEMFEKISGYKKDELIGKPHNIVRHPDMPRSIFKKLWATIEGGKIFRGTIKNKKKDGGEYWVLANVIPIKDEDGKIMEYIAIRQDITKRIQAQKESENLLKNFITYMKRKLQTPLFRINKYLTMLGDEKKEVIAIKRELNNIQLLMNNLEVANELKDGAENLDIKPIPLEKIVKYLYNKYKPLYNKKMLISIEDKGVVNADKRLLLLAFENIFATALEHAKEKIYIGLDDEKFFVKTDKKCTIHAHSGSILRDIKNGKEVDAAVYNVYKILKLFQFELKTTENSLIIRF
ncbi:MAG: PAS domain S-box protein [Epsilonproteobacteria bacterium]|nr:PAS domain S-box protein [Campylobacterota bacterium]